MEEISINTEMRDKTGVKGVLSKIRSSKMVPAVVYGEGKEPVNVSVSDKDLALLLKKGSNTIINLSLNGENVKAVLKDIQHHIVSGKMLHADFQRIALDKKMEFKVPVVLEGTAPGVKLHGAIVDHVSRELHIRCTPANIPHEIKVDISALDIGRGITVADVKPPEGVEFVEKADRMVVHLVMPAAEVVAAPAAAEGAAAAAQPEVIEKGKKEEGEAAAGKDAKPSAAKEEKK